MLRILIAAWSVAVLSASALAQSCDDLTAAQQARSLQTHLIGGNPSGGELLIRRGYVMEYDTVHRGPRWAAWHASPDYRPTPDRNRSRWKRFRTDDDVPNPVEDDDYDGLHATPDNFARGHIVPFYISGGDRDRDGQTAAESDGNQIVDQDDACTVFEINYMSNITPQYHNRFNGTGGLWNDLETALRSRIDAGAEFHILAGSIFGASDVQYVGPDSDIGVPDMFYKIVVTTEGPVGFLFAHRRQLVPIACPLTADLDACIVPISVIEQASGLDFFADLPDALERDFEAVDGSSVWASVIGAP